MSDGRTRDDEHRMITDELIEALARDLEQVNVMRPPAMRAAAFLLPAVIYVWLLVLSVSDTWPNAADVRFVVAVLSAVVTSALAVVAAFASVVPGHSKRILVWLTVAAVPWMSTLTTGALRQSDAAVILGARQEWLCVSVIVLGGTPLLALLAMMLRRGAPLNPAVTAGLAAIGVGALTDVGARASQQHVNDATLVWHAVAILALVLVCSSCARFVFTWRAAQSSSLP